MKVLVPLLIVSLVANVYLYVTRVDANVAAEEAVEPISPRPAKPRPALPSLSRYQALERAELEQLVATAEADVVRYLPPNEKFEQQKTRSTEIEAQIRPYLDRVFKDFTTSPKYALECHDLVCKLEPNTRGNTSDDDWLSALQTTYPDRIVLFHSMLFGPDGTFLEVKDAGEQVISRIRLAAFPRLQTCELEHAPHGVLTHVFVMEAGRIALRLNGSLANHPYAACVREAFERASALVPVHAGIAIPQESWTVTLPSDR